MREIGGEMVKLRTPREARMKAFVPLVMVAALGVAAVWFHDLWTIGIWVAGAVWCAWFAILAAYNAGDYFARVESIAQQNEMRGQMEALQAHAERLDRLVNPHRVEGPS